MTETRWQRLMFSNGFVDRNGTFQKIARSFLPRISGETDFSLTVFLRAYQDLSHTLMRYPG